MASRKPHPIRRLYLKIQSSSVFWSEQLKTDKGQIKRNNVRQVKQVRDIKNTSTSQKKGHQKLYLCSKLNSWELLSRTDNTDKANRCHGNIIKRDRKN